MNLKGVMSSTLMKRKKGPKLQFNKNGIRLGKLTIKRLIKTLTLIKITKVLLLN